MGGNSGNKFDSDTIRQLQQLQQLLIRQTGGETSNSINQGSSMSGLGGGGGAGVASGQDSVKFNKKLLDFDYDDDDDDDNNKMDSPHVPNILEV